MQINSQLFSKYFQNNEYNHQLPRPLRAYLAPVRVSATAMPARCRVPALSVPQLCIGAVGALEL